MPGVRIHPIINEGSSVLRQWGRCDSLPPCAARRAPAHEELSSGTYGEVVLREDADLPALTLVRGRDGWLRVHSTQAC